MTDYHLHTPLCHHAEHWPADYIEPALAAGLEEIGFSEHGPMASDDFDDWRMATRDLPRYLDEIERARQLAGPRLPIRLGLECDYLADSSHLSWLERLASEQPWDYWIGSVHYLDDLFPLDDPRQVDRWGAMDIEDIWTRYWQLFIRATRSGLFHFMAHPDLVKKFGHRPAGDLRRFHEPAVQALLDSDIAFEYSTAGQFKPCAEAYPADSFLLLAQSAGVPLVISSDAHQADHVGRGFDAAARHLASLGFSHLARFQGGRRTLHPLTIPT